MGYRFIKNNVLATIFLGILNAQTVAVTFQVGMGNETVSNGVWLAGGDAGNPGFEMTDSNGDMIYTVTLDVPQDARYHYKFVNGPLDQWWNGAWETVPEACGVGQHFDRYVDVESEDMVLVPVVFGTCDYIEPIYVINDFNEPLDVLDEGDGAFWEEYDESESDLNFSNLSQITDTEYTFDGSPVMGWNYGVVGTFSWGGYTAELSLFDQVVDLSGYNYISFKLRNLTQPQIGGVFFRFVLFDVSNTTSWSSRDDVEVWFSFFEGNQSPLYNDSEDGWVEYRIPLQSSGTTAPGTSYTQGFTKTGWVGIPGNDILDIDQIGGIAIEVVSTTQGAVAQGEFLLEDIQAVFSPTILGCTDVNACNYNPDADEDDGSCYECSDITFRVDMSNETAHSQGVYMAGGTLGQEGYLMEDSDGDDIWETTLELRVGDTTRYKFRNQPALNSWNGFEPAGGLISGGCSAPDDWFNNVNDNYDDRFIIVPNMDITLPTVCYGSCDSCDEQNMVDVTFSVNMSDIETNPAGAHISGEAFPEPGLTMLDPDGDDVWTITVQKSIGELLRYKFANGPVPNWSGDWETVPLECQHADNTDRWVIVGETDMELETVCFNRCTSCIDDYPVDVTFNLDMGNAAGFDGTQQPYVFGSYNEWDYYTPTLLSDSDGDNIFTGTIENLMFYDSVTVLFAYGQNFETVPQECGVSDTDLGMYVRLLPITDADGEETLVLDPVEYGGCPLDDTPKALFQVDASSVINLWPEGYDLCVTGSFDAWSGCGLSLSDSDGDNIFSGILTGLTDGDNYEYKFLVNVDGNALWDDPNYDSGPPLGSACDFNPEDNYTNYGFTAVAGIEPLDLGVQPWNGCVALSNDSDNRYLVPKDFSCKAYPNPFNPFVTIHYELENNEFVKLSIINILGQRVKTLVNADQDLGVYSYSWNGRDMNGAELNSGIYFAVIDHGSSRDILKITYLK